MRKGILFSSLVFAIAALPMATRAASAPSETLSAPGLIQPVEIIKDRWGISHIYAKNETDLFFAQGYNVARDRLFQLEMWRRQATGTVAEILGKGELQRDIGNRLFLFRGDLSQETSWYHPHGTAIIKAFVDGINAYIAETERDPALLTPEFKMLGIKPGKWTPAVVISRFNGLLGNVEQEVRLASAIQAIGVDKVKDIMYFQPADPKLEIDPAIDASLLSSEILGVYHAFRTPAEIHSRMSCCRNTATRKRLCDWTRKSNKRNRPERPPARYRQQQLGREWKAHGERVSDDDE